MMMGTSVRRYRYLEINSIEARLGLALVVICWEKSLYKAVTNRSERSGEVLSFVSDQTREIHAIEVAGG
jgi:hypothetical protein